MCQQSCLIVINTLYDLFYASQKKEKNKDNDIGTMSQSIGNVSSQTRVKIIYHKTPIAIYICIWYRFQKMQRTVNPNETVCPTFQLGVTMDMFYNVR